MFSVGGGRVARIFIAETPGYYNTDDLTLEDVRDHWDQVRKRGRLRRPEQPRRGDGALRSLLPLGREAVEVGAFRAEADAWLAEHASGGPRDYGAILPPDLVDQGVDWQRLLYADGWAGIHWPVELGGRGLTPGPQRGVDRGVRAWPGCPPFLNMVGLVLAGGAIQRSARPSSRSAPRARRSPADHVWCQLFSEPGAGSDLGACRTRAERDGERFVVNGQKVWCSGGRYSDWGILMARTDPSAAKHKGISFFLLDMRLPGIEVRPLRQMTGEAEFDEVFFTDVELPADCLLGPLHGGWGVGMAVLTSERGHIGASVIGLERRLEAMRRLGGDRRLEPARTPGAGRSAVTGDRPRRGSASGRARSRRRRRR